MTTPHHVGQVAKAEIFVAHLLDTAPADADHERIASTVVAQLLNAGWAAPRDLGAVPALRPDQVATADQRRAHLAHIDNEIAAVRRQLSAGAKEEQA